MRAFWRRRRLLEAFGLRFHRLRMARQRARRRPVVWVYPRPQFWLEEILNNAVMHRGWKQHFRVSRPTFDRICQLVAPDSNRQDTRLRRAVSLEKRVAVALWRLGTGNAFRVTAVTFGAGKATAVEICHEFCEAINSKKEDFMKFPEDDDETQDCIRKFAGKVDFPQVVGAIDGTHVEIKAPLTNPADFISTVSSIIQLLPGRWLVQTCLSSM